MPMLSELCIAISWTAN